MDPRIVRIVSSSYNQRRSGRLQRVFIKEFEVVPEKVFTLMVIISGKLHNSGKV